MTTLTETSLTKVCCKCKTEKPVDLFPRHKNLKGGRHPYCKKCKSNYYFKNAALIVQKYRIKRLEYYQKIKSDREKYAKLRISLRKRLNAFKLRHPMRVKANSKVRTAIRSGKIVRPNECSSCGFQCKPEAHHDSYEKSQWLVVRWLCRNCHCAYHRKYPDSPK
jgi:hypothetical protein